MLLIQRANRPTPGGWALPGGVLKPEIDGSLDHTALRILATKTRVALPHLEKDAPQLVAVKGEFLRGAQRPAQMYRAAVGFAF